MIVAHTDIQLHVARFTRALDDTVDLSAKVMYINMFERDLERLRGTFQSTWGDDVELNLIGAKLYLYSHIFVARSKENYRVGKVVKPLLGDSGWRKIVYSGLSAAVSYIHAFSEQGRQASSPSASSPIPLEEPVQLRCYPHHYWRTLVLAAFYLLKFLALDSDSTETERELARNHLTTSYDTFMSYPNSIEHIAVAKTIEMLAKTSGIPAESKVNTRLGASIIYDALLTFSQLQKARSAGKLDREESEVSMIEATSGIPEDASQDDGFSIAEFLSTDWDLPWDTNFFDVGMETRDR
jgi:hypothetical protein